MNESCIDRRGHRVFLSTELRGLLAYILDTTIPAGMKIMACHACTNGRCSNPYHLYWGTAKENHADGVACGRKGKITDLMLKKYGPEKTLELWKKAGRAGGKKGIKKLIEHRRIHPPPTKINWPTTEELVKLVANSSYTAVGKLLGVSDVSVHIRLEKEGIRRRKKVLEERILLGIALECGGLL